MSRRGGHAQNTQIGSQPLERLCSGSRDKVLFPCALREGFCVLPVTHGLFTPKATLLYTHSCVHAAGQRWHRDTHGAGTGTGTLQHHTKSKTPSCSCSFLETRQTTALGISGSSQGGGQAWGELPEVPKGTADCPWLLVCAVVTLCNSGSLPQVRCKQTSKPRNQGEIP